MKPIALVGVLLLVLGMFSFVVPVPRKENHGVKIGDTTIGVQTENSEKLPPAAPWTPKASTLKPSATCMVPSPLALTAFDPSAIEPPLPAVSEPDC